MFNQATRQSILAMAAMAYSANGIASTQLPPVGFLSKVIVAVEANITTGAAGTYSNTVAPVPTPYTLIPRIRVYTNEGAEIYNTSAYGNYLLQRTLQEGFDPRNPIASFSSTGTAARIYNVPATYAVSTAYSLRFAIFIPIAWQEGLLAGLILLQNPTTHLQLELTFADATQNLISTAGGTVTVNSINIRPAVEIFNLPDSPQDNPDLSMAHVILEDTQTITANGDFVYRPTLGNMYLQVIQAFVNNNLPEPPTDFTGFKLAYAQTQQAYNITPDIQWFLQRYRASGIDLPDGVVWWDFIYGTGLIQAGNTRDVIDTARLTDMTITSTIAPTVTITNPANVRTIREMLAPIAR